MTPPSEAPAGQAIEAARKIVAEWAGMPKDSLFGMAALVAADYEALIEECERLRRFVDGTIAKTAALSGFTPSVKPKLKRKIVDFYCAYCGTFQGLSGPFAYCPTCELVCRETIPIASDEPPPVFPNDCCDKLDDCCCWGPALDLKKDQP